MQTYRAILKGDRLKWTDSEPTDLDPEQLVEVTILNISEDTDAGDRLEWTVLDVADDTPASTQGLRMANALERLAASNTLSQIEDPVEWQREIRKDRPLPDREV